jgi:hypothetical protein
LILVSFGNPGNGFSHNFAVDMAVDIAFLALNLALFTGLGFPVCLLLPVQGRFLAAPAFGLGIFGVAATVLYRFGVPLHWVGLAAWACAAASALALWWQAIDRRSVTLVAGFVATVALLTLAPKWVGGPQFSAFQGNEWDHFNYIAAASAYEASSYAELLNLVNPSINNFWAFAAQNLAQRPSVSIVLASIRWPFFQTVADSAYVFLCLLQVIEFFTLSFLLVGVMRASLMRGMTIAIAITIGFVFQYVFDINAWSEMASISFGVLLVCCVVLAIRSSGEPSLHRIIRIGAAVGIALTSVLYFYPEMIPVYGVACASAALVGWRLNQTREWLLRIGAIVGGVSTSVALCLPYWRGTIEFFLGRQLSDAVAVKVRSFAWFSVADGPFMGRDVAYGTVFSDGSLGERIYAIMSLPVDIGLGTFGVYFLSPPAGLPIAVRAGWKMAAAAAMAAMLYISLRCAWQLWKERDDRIPMIGAAIAVLITPFGLLLTENVWAAGKAFSMGAPLFFLLVVLPVVLGRPTWSTIPSIALLVLHAGFGVERVFAAANPDGILRQAPYMGSDIDNVSAKQNIDWDFPGIADQLRLCRHLALDLKDQHLDRYAQVYVTDLGIHWNSRRPLNSYYGRGDNLGQHPDPVDADCLLTDNAERWGNRRVFWRGRSPAGLVGYYQGEQVTLPLAPATLPSGLSFGLYGVEDFRGSKLQWTNGEAKITVPENRTSPSRYLAVALWDVIPPGTTVEISVNGRVLRDGLSWSGTLVWELPEPTSETAEIVIRSTSRKYPSDTRTLGVPLRSVTLMK